MKKWQKIVLAHLSNVKVLNDDQVFIPLIGYDKIGDIDEIVNRVDREYHAIQFRHNTDEKIGLEVFESLRDYLGY